LEALKVREMESEDQRLMLEGDVEEDERVAYFDFKAASRSSRSDWASLLSTPYKSSTSWWQSTTSRTPDSKSSMRQLWSPTPRE
jgi:hypothetical protein